MIRKIAAAVGVGALVLVGTGCDKINEAADTVDQTLVTEDVTGVGQEELAIIRELAKTDGGLAALRTAGYVATASVTTENGSHYLRFKVCNKSARPESCRKSEAPTQETPDVHINLSEAPTTTSIKLSGTYDLAYPVGSEGLKYRYLCAMQGQPAATNQATGLTKAVVGEFSAIGAIAVDAVDQVQQVKGNEWKCNHQVLKENFS